MGFDSHFLGYRHAGYYLPEYLTIQFPEVPLASTTGVFAMRRQDTRLVSAVSTSAPSGTSFCSRCHLQTTNIASICNTFARALSATGELRVIVLNGREFLTGPVSALSSAVPLTYIPA